jgi:chromate transporter
VSATVLQLLLMGATLSLISFGGVTAVIPGIHHDVVDNHGWMSAAGFARSYGIAVLVPGSNVVLFAVLGHQIAGVPGALAAFLGFVVPTVALNVGAASAGERLEAPLARLQQALRPVVIGSLIAGAVAVSETVDSPVEVAIAMGVLVVLVLRDVNPLLLMGLAAALGAVTFS